METRTRQVAIMRSVIILDEDLFTLTDDAGVGQYGGLALKAFDEEQSVLLHSVSFKGNILLLSPFIAAAAGDWAIGWTAPTTGDKAVSANDVLAPQAFTASSRAASFNAGAPVGAWRANPATLRLKVWTDDNVAHATTPGNKVSGVVTILWSRAGDNAA